MGSMLFATRIVVSAANIPIWNRLLGYGPDLLLAFLVLDGETLVLYMQPTEYSGSQFHSAIFNGV